MAKCVWHTEYGMEINLTKTDRASDDRIPGQFL